MGGVVMGELEASNLSEARLESQGDGEDDCAIGVSTANFRKWS